MILIEFITSFFLAECHSQCESEGVDCTAAVNVSPAAIAIVMTNSGIDILVKQLMFDHTTKLSVISH